MFINKMQDSMLKQETPFRPGNSEHLSTQRSNRVPKCILELPAANGARKPLSEEELQVAKKELLKIDFIMTKYARERKFRVDSQVVGQNFGIITFKPSKGAKPDKRGCFGVIKLRGNYSNTDSADKRCDVLLGEDENLDIDMPLVGKEFPLMLNNEEYTYSVRDVDTKQVITDSTNNLMREKQEQEEKEKKQMFDKQRKLLDNTNEEEKETTLSDYDLYVQLRTKKANNFYVIDKCNGNMVNCKKNIELANTEIKQMDKKHPSYKEEYLKTYVKEIKAVGIDPKQMEIIQYMIDDVNIPDEIKEELNPTQIKLTQNSEEEKVDIEVEDIISIFTRDRKYRTDPELMGQQIGLLSFIPSKGAVPDTNGAFGVLKLRGNFSSAAEAEKWCDMLIRDYDSYSVNELVFVGKEHPLFINRNIYKSPHAEDDLKDIITKVVKTYLKEVEDRRKQEEKDMVERQAKLRINEDKETDKSTVEYYTVLNVKKAYNKHQLIESEVTLEKCKLVIDEIEKEILDMDKEFPDFRQEYLQKYIDACKAAGNAEQNDSLIKYLIDDHEREAVREALRVPVIEEVTDEEKKEE